MTLSYEAWRASHIILGASVQAGACVHAALVDRYLSLQGATVIAATAVATTLAVVSPRLLQPLAGLRRRYVVRDERGGAPTLALSALGHRGSASCPGNSHRSSWAEPRSPSPSILSRSLRAQRVGTSSNSPRRCAATSPRGSGRSGPGRRSLATCPTGASVRCCLEPARADLCRDWDYAGNEPDEDAQGSRRSTARPFDSAFCLLR